MSRFEEQYLHVRDRIIAALPELTGYPLNDAEGRANVLGVGLGFKKGDSTMSLAVRLYVLAGTPLTKPLHIAFLKNLLEDLTLEIVPTRSFVAFGSHAVPAHRPPAVPGSTVQFQSTTGQGLTGAIGMILVDSTGQRYAVSANHILSIDGDAPARPGFQVNELGVPGLNLVGRKIGSNVFAEPIGSKLSVDCAMVRLDDGASVRQSVSGIAPIVWTPKPIQLGQSASKRGPDGKVRAGVVRDHLVKAGMRYTPPLPGVVTFENIALVEDDSPTIFDGHFASEGDSGGLVFQKSEGNWFPTGLIIGGSSPRLPEDPPELHDFTVICDIVRVIAALNNRLDANLRPLNLAPLEP